MKKNQINQFSKCNTSVSHSVMLSERKDRLVVLCHIIKGRSCNSKHIHAIKKARVIELQSLNVNFLSSKLVAIYEIIVFMAFSNKTE